MKKIAILALALLSAVQGMETTTTISSPPSKFKQISSDFNTYKAHATPERKHQIIMDLTNLMLEGGLKDKEREGAIKIAEGINAQNLKVRLDVCLQQQDRRNFNSFPSDVMHIIIREFLEGGSNSANTLLHTSKYFNFSLLSMPISLNVKDCKTKYKGSITNKILARNIELFPKMRALSLPSCVHVTYEGLPPLKSLTQLTYLDFSGSKDISNLWLRYIKNLTQLTYLDLGGHLEENTISDLEPLKDFTRLIHLNLNSREISNPELKNLKSLTMLTYLGLSRGGFTDVGLENLKDLTRLTHLNLRATLITGTGLEGLKDLTRLTRINLTWCDSFTEEGLHGLRSLIQLNELNFQGCSSTSAAGLGYTLKILTRLTHLNLVDSDDITDEELENLEGLLHLTELNLGGCKRISRAGAQNLKDVLPNLHITM